MDLSWTQQSRFWLVGKRSIYWLRVLVLTSSFPKRFRDFSGYVTVSNKVKTQYVHFRLHYTNYFLLPWKIPEELSTRSMVFNDYERQYNKYVHTVFYHWTWLTWNRTRDPSHTNPLRTFSPSKWLRNSLVVMVEDSKARYGWYNPITQHFDGEYQATPVTLPGQQFCTCIDGRSCIDEEFGHTLFSYSSILWDSVDLRLINEVSIIALICCVFTLSRQNWFISLLAELVHQLASRTGSSVCYSILNNRQLIQQLKDL